jgi:putative nucleotidyltransferase with HDIG domain/PAS domain S-box-containing protein
MSVKPRRFHLAVPDSEEHQRSPRVDDLERFDRALSSVVETVVEAVRDPILLLESDLRVRFVNQAFLDAFKVETHEFIEPFSSIGEGYRWNIPELRDRLAGLCSADPVFNDLRIDYAFPRVGRKVVRASGRRLAGVADGSTTTILLVLSDATDRKIAAQTGDESASILRGFYDSLPFVMGVVEIEGEDFRCVSANETSALYFGVEPGTLEGRTAVEIGIPIDRIRFWLEKFQECKNIHDSVSFRYPKPTSGGERWIRGIACRIGPGPSGRDRFSFFAEDVTDRIETELEIRQLNARLEQRLNYLGGLRKIDKAITVSPDRRLVLGVVLEQACSQLNVEAARARIHDPKGRYPDLVVSRGLPASLRSTIDQMLNQIIIDENVAVYRYDSSPSDVVSPVSEEGIAALVLEGFVFHAAAPLVSKGEAFGVLDVFSKTGRKPDSEWLGYLETLAGQAAIGVDNATLFEDLRRSNEELIAAYDATIEGWSRAMDLRDHETEGHGRRVATLAEALAKEIGVVGEDLARLRRGALLHDIGKMIIPDSILRKPGPLTDDEWVIMKRHPELAVELLEPIAFLRSSLDIPHYHHERWDGTGYPLGLKGEEIPLAARIFSVVDIWDAITNDRPYHKAWPIERARNHIRSLAGGHLDPAVVAVFLTLVGERRTDRSRRTGIDPGTPRPKNDFVL